ncbi:MAG: GNAT family N-acetyltransferase, partial [Lachnospira sp.]
ILADIDGLDYEDKHYKRRKTYLEESLYKAYDKMDEIENSLAGAKVKKRSIMADKVTRDNIYKALIYFEDFYDKMNDSERREFMSVLLENVQINEYCRALWNAVLEENLSGKITVHSSLYAVAVYEKLGFVQTDDVRDERKKQ